MVRIGLGGLTVLGDLGTSSGTRGGGSSGISGTIGESPRAEWVGVLYFG